MTDCEHTAKAAAVREHEVFTNLSAWLIAKQNRMVCGHLKSGVIPRDRSDFIEEVFLLDDRRGFRRVKQLQQMPSWFQKSEAAAANAVVATEK